MSDSLLKIDMNNLNLNNLSIDEISINEAIEFAKNKIYKSDIEKLIVIFTKADKAMCYTITAEGSEDSSDYISQGEIARTALLLGADGIIEMHNHPNDALKFSFNDFNVMKEAYRAFSSLDIKLIDCMIVVPSNKILSMKDIGLIATYETFYSKYSGFEAVYMKYMESWEYEEEMYSLKKNVERINGIIEKYGNKEAFNHFYGK